MNHLEFNFLKELAERDGVKITYHASSSRIHDTDKGKVFNGESRVNVHPDHTEFFPSPEAMKESQEWFKDPRVTNSYFSCNSGCGCVKGEDR